MPYKLLLKYLFFSRKSEVNFKMVVEGFKAVPSHGKLILLWDSIERIMLASQEEESTFSGILVVCLFITQFIFIRIIVLHRTPSP